MAKVYTAAPVLLFAGIPQLSIDTIRQPVYDIQFLGTGEYAPDIELIPEYQPIRRDLSGRRTPWDVSFMSESATIVCSLSRYEDDTIRLLQARPGYTNGGEGPLGSWKLGDVGRMMRTEFLTHPVWMKFVGASGGAGPFGYRFPYCYLAGPDRMRHRAGRIIQLAWHALPQYDEESKEFLLYDRDITGVASIKIG